MCYTPYCFGECEECQRQQQIEQDFRESSAECPYKKECDWETLDVKTDRCKTCGLITNY